MKNEDVKKYHGYLALPRQSKFLYQHLGARLYGFYITLVMEAGWDRRYPSFGKVKGTQAEIARRLKVNQSTISRNLDALANKNIHLALPHKNHLILGFFPLFCTDVAQRIFFNDYPDLHKLYAAVHQINAELQEKNAILQADLLQKNSQSLYISSNDKFYSQVSNEEYIDNDEVDIGIERIKREKEQENRS